MKQLSPTDSRLLLAGLLAAIGEYKRTAVEYRDLAPLQLQNADIAAAFGALALREHDYQTARQEWKRALVSGVANPELCYQYAPGGLGGHAGGGGPLGAGAGNFTEARLEAGASGEQRRRV